MYTNNKGYIYITLCNCSDCVVFIVCHLIIWGLGPDKETRQDANDKRR